MRFSVNFISSDQEAISAQLKHMYEADFVECTPHRTAMSVEDHRALAIMESSVSKIDGHYQLALPRRFESPCLPKNKAIAEKRLGLLRRRFERNEHLFEKYKRTVADYIDKGHARMVPEEQQNPGDRPVW